MIKINLVTIMGTETDFTQQDSEHITRLYKE